MANKTRTTAKPSKRKTSPKAAVPVRQTITPGIEFVTTGKGFTKTTAVRVDPSTDAGKAFLGKLAALEYGEGFSKWVASEERLCLHILEKAGLPTDPLGVYVIPGGEKILSVASLDEFKTLSPSPQLLPPDSRVTGNLPLFIEASGFREGEHLEWYAAKILLYLRATKEFIGEKKAEVAAVSAFHAGKLIGEAKALGFFESAGSAGGKKKRKTLPVSKLISYLKSEEKNATPKELFSIIPTDEIEGIRIKTENGLYKFYRKGNRVHALAPKGGIKDWRPVGKPFGFDAFRMRVYSMTKKDGK